MGNINKKLSQALEMPRKGRKDVPTFTQEDLKLATCIFNATTRINVVGNKSNNVSSNTSSNILDAISRIETVSPTDQRRKKTTVNAASQKNEFKYDIGLKLKDNFSCNKADSVEIEPERPPSRRGRPLRRTLPSKSRPRSLSATKKVYQANDKSGKEDNSDHKSTERKGTSTKPGDKKKPNPENISSKSILKEKEEKKTNSKSTPSKKNNKRSTNNASQRKRSLSEKRGERKTQNSINNNNDRVGKGAEDNAVVVGSNPADISESGPIESTPEDEYSQEGAGDEIKLPPETYPVMPWHVIPNPRVVQFWNTGPSGLLIEAAQKFPVDWFRLPGEEHIPICGNGRFSRPHSNSEWSNVNTFLHEVDQHLEPLDITNPALKRYFACRKEQLNRN